ncbi:MAG: hypothetical protein Q8Q04_01000 [archaeon]|nr:hypothetical protein [archaeon]
MKQILSFIKNQWVEILFWLQIIMSWIYTIPLVIQIISGKTGGLNLATYSIYLIYLGLSLSLAFSSFFSLKKEIGNLPNFQQQKALKARKQTIIIFSQWAFLVSLVLLFGLRNIVWKERDTVICLIILVLSLLTLIKYKGLKDPYSKGFLNVWCKSVPQLWLGYTIFADASSEGLPFLTLFFGYLTALQRLIQVWIAGRRGIWDKSTKGLMMGEGSNVLSWSIVVVLWVVFRLN